MNEPLTNGTALTEGETEDQHADDLQPLDEVQRLKDQLVAEQQENKAMKIKLSQLYARVGELSIEKEDLEKKLSHEVNYIQLLRLKRDHYTAKILSTY